MNVEELCDCDVCQENREIGYARGYSAALNAALDLVGKAYKEHVRECPEEITGFIQEKLLLLMKDREKHNA